MWLCLKSAVNLAALLMNIIVTLDEVLQLHIEVLIAVLLSCCVQKRLLND